MSLWSEYCELLQDYAYPEVVKWRAFKRLVRKKLGLDYSRLDGRRPGASYPSLTPWWARVIDWCEARKK